MANHTYLRLVQEMRTQVNPQVYLTASPPHLGSVKAVSQSRHPGKDLLGALAKWLDLRGCNRIVAAERSRCICS